jgi:tetratricopeptide (TPR) repeat protein
LRVEEGFRLRITNLAYFLILTALTVSAHAQLVDLQKVKAFTEKKDDASDRESSLKLYREAKAIIVDALPGEQIHAEKLLIESIRLFPGNIDSYIELAKLIQLQVAQGTKNPFELQKSIELVTQAYEMAPNRPRACFAKADILYYSGHIKAAEDMYLETLGKYPEHMDSLVEKGRIYSEKNPKEALKNIEEAIRKGANMDDISHYAAIALAKSEIPGKAAFALKEFAKKHPDRWLWHRTALSYVGVKNYHEATLAFEKAISLGNDIESRLQLAVLQYTIQNKYNFSLSNLDKLLEALSKRQYISPSAYSLVYAHISMANYKNNNKSDAAIAALYSAQTSYDNKKFYSSLVSEYKKIDAMQILDKSLKYLTKEEPSYLLPYIIFAEMFRNDKKFDESIEMYTKAIVLDNSKDDLYAERALTYYKIKYYENALRDFESALKLNANNPIYLYNKACMLALLGRKREALENLKLALNEDKKLVELARLDSDFASLKSDTEYSSQFASLILDEVDDKWVATDSEIQ